MSLGIGEYSPVEIALRDKGGEIGTFSAYGLPLVEASFDDYLALAEDFYSAVNAATLGIIVHTYYGVKNILNPVGNAGSASAQRENKLLIRFHDLTTQKKMTATLPTIDLPNLVFLPEAEDKVNMTTPAAISGLVTAWEDFIVNPETGNLTVIDSMEYVGRNT